jgi:SAM-dependent methyltransferase
MPERRGRCAAGDGARGDEPVERRIVDCWHDNARAWTVAVRSGRIESRRLVTDRAIVEAVVGRRPATVLDVGCGEGWLARELNSRGIDVLGIDVVPALVEEARRGGGRFERLSYRALSEGALDGPFDVVVANFSLFGRRSVDDVFRGVRALLADAGALIVQTLHPDHAEPAGDGWRPGSWQGLGDGFGDPPPWYLRSRAGWERLFADHGLALVDVREPIDPRTGRPASVLFVGARRRGLGAVPAVR